MKGTSKTIEPLALPLRGGGTALAVGEVAVTLRLRCFVDFSHLIRQPFGLPPSPQGEGKITNFWRFYLNTAAGRRKWSGA